MFSAYFSGLVRFTGICCFLVWKVDSRSLTFELFTSSTSVCLTARSFCVKLNHRTLIIKQLTFNFIFSQLRLLKIILHETHERNWLLSKQVVLRRIAKSRGEKKRKRLKYSNCLQARKQELEDRTIQFGKCFLFFNMKTEIET